MSEGRDRSSGWIGTVLSGKWHIDAKVARGGVATVFRATHRQGQVAAIKIMHPEYSRNEDVRRRFLLEGYAANKVGHPGVVRVLDDDVTEDGSAYIVMELLQNGEDLEDRRTKRGGKLPVAEVAQICDQVLDVLAAAHEKGIVHRDIKPENIFVLADDTVKVLDFGIAHIKQELVKHEPTATGLLLGTPDYMSPEQALGVRGHIDAQTDIYALGATMFTLLSSESVHTHDSLGVLLVATGTRQARSLASAAKDLPREVIAVVDKALALEKARRWPNARAMQAALRAAVPGSARHRAMAKQTPSLPPPPAPSLPPPPPRSLPPPPMPRRSAPTPAPTPAPAKAPESDPWTDEFEDGDMEGPTVATIGSGRAPQSARAPKVLTKPEKPELPEIVRDKEVTQSLPRDFVPPPMAPQGQTVPAFLPIVPSHPPPPPPLQPQSWMPPPAEHRPVAFAAPKKAPPAALMAMLGILGLVIVSLLIAAALWFRSH